MSERTGRLHCYQVSLCVVCRQVTEKTDSHADNLQVGLELWDKQLGLGAEVDSWAGAKLALFAESHPFHSEEQVLAMRVSHSLYRGSSLQARTTTRRVLP